MYMIRELLVSVVWYSLVYLWQYLAGWIRNVVSGANVVIFLFWIILWHITAHNLTGARVHKESPLSLVMTLSIVMRFSEGKLCWISNGGQLWLTIFFKVEKNSRFFLTVFSSSPGSGGNICCAARKIQNAPSPTSIMDSDVFHVSLWCARFYECSLLWSYMTGRNIFFRNVRWTHQIQKKIHSYVCKRDQLGGYSL